MGTPQAIAVFSETIVIENAALPPNAVFHSYPQAVGVKYVLNKG